MVFAQAVFLLVPNDTNLGMKEHFLKIRQMFYALITIFVTFNFAFQFIIEDSERSLMRGISIVVYGLNIFFDNLALRIAAMSVTILALIAIFYYQLY